MKHRALIARLMLAGGALAAGTAMLATPAIAQPAERDFVLYDDTKDIDQVLAKFEKYYEEKFNQPIKLVYFSQPGEELVLTLELEARSKQMKADVVIVNHTTLKRLQETYGIFEAPILVEERRDPAIPELLRDPTGDGASVPLNVDSDLIIYNTNLVKPEEMKSWSDLLDEKWRGKIGIGDPQTTGGALPPLWFITQYLGKSKGAPYGWDFYNRLGELDPHIGSSHGAIRELVIAGELLVSINGLAGAVVRANGGDPVAAVLPTEGAPVSIQAAGVVKGSAGADIALEFCRWLFTKEGVEAVRDQKQGFTTRTDVEPTKYPFPFDMDPTRLVPVDGDWLANNRDEYLAKAREALQR